MSRLQHSGDYMGVDLAEAEWRVVQALGCRQMILSIQFLPLAGPDVCIIFIALLALNEPDGLEILIVVGEFLGYAVEFGTLGAHVVQVQYQHFAFTAAFDDGVIDEAGQAAVRKLLLELGV